MTAAVLQYQSNAFFGKVSGQLTPMINCVIGDFLSFFLISLSHTNCVVVVVMDQHCIDYGNIDTSIV